MTSRQFLFIVIVTFITGIIWVSLNIIHSNSQVQIPEEVKLLIEPINPNFDTQSISNL